MDAFCFKKKTGTLKKQPVMVGIFIHGFNEVYNLQINIVYKRFKNEVLPMCCYMLNNFSQGHCNDGPVIILVGKKII